MNLDIVVMQAFNGFSYFTVLLLMALGLAIIFGLMGVINMAHGELMAMGAYVTYFTGEIFQKFFPTLMGTYLFVAIISAFLVTFCFGFLLERSMIRFLYKRPLDTLLATWGLSLILQQVYRSLFGPQEVSVPLPHWLEGAWRPTSAIQLPMSRIFIIALTIAVSLGVYLFLFKSRWGLRIRAVTQNRAMSGAVGINTNKVDAVTFAVGAGLAGIAGSAFTMIGSTSPSSGSLYIVDTFMVVVFGGVQSLLGTFLSAFVIAQAKSILEYLLSGSMATVLVLLIVIMALYFRPNGLFVSKVRK
ncbi:MAG: urea ABC transporter permease subunit UrtB [Burkholderiales bacterium]